MRKWQGMKPGVTGLGRVRTAVAAALALAGVGVSFRSRLHK
jgi:hypothetical protein